MHANEALRLRTTLGFALQRVEGLELAMPGLSPTFGQASRLFGLRADECRQVLELLQREEFLRCGPDGQYRMK